MYIARCATLDCMLNNIAYSDSWMLVNLKVTGEFAISIFNC